MKLWRVLKKQVAHFLLCLWPMVKTQCIKQILIYYLILLEVKISNQSHLSSVEMLSLFVPSEASEKKIPLVVFQLQVANFSVNYLRDLSHTYFSFLWSWLLWDVPIFLSFLVITWHLPEKWKIISPAQDPRLNHSHRVSLNS